MKVLLILSILGLLNTICRYLGNNGCTNVCFWVYLHTCALPIAIIQNISLFKIDIYIKLTIYGCCAYYELGIRWVYEVYSSVSKLILRLS